MGLAVSYEKKSYEEFRAELDEMIDFYKDDNYGPYTACHGEAVPGGSFICKEHVDDLKPRLSQPTRLGSALLVHADTFMVGFNMDGPHVFEAKMAFWNISFVVVAMVGSGLALSQVVTDLAVRPLERMLTTVRTIASTVFKLGKDVEEDDISDDEMEEEVYDVEGTSEMELLETVVQKLAVVAELHTKHTTMDRTEDMRDEDLGILSMLQGNSVAQNTGGAGRRTLKAAQLDMARRKSHAHSQALEDIGITADMYNSLEFNILDLSKQQKLTIAFFTIAHFHAPGDGFVRTQEEKNTLKRFVNAAEKEYKPNPFHNLAHATDCVHMVAKMLRKTGSYEFLAELEQFALLIAGISHDLAHPGVNNGFLSEVGHELALQYNDRSPLENMHCATMYSLVAEEEQNVFGKLTREQYKEVRKHCVETILHTDMMNHNTMVKDLQMTFQMHAEVFVEGDDTVARSAELEVFNQSDVKVLIMNNFLHSADVSNPCRTWETASAWSWMVIEEFFAQGDEERRLGIPVQFLNDRNKLNKPNSQIGFIEFMIAPFYFAQIKLFPGLGELGEELVRNLSKWEEMWSAEVNPSEEDLQKVRARVQKVADNYLEAKNRGGS